MSAERLVSYLPPDWEEWTLFLLGEMAIEDEEFGPVLLDFPDFIHILLTRWIYPPELPHPFAVKVDIVNYHFPDPPDEPALPAGQPVRAQSLPPSPLRTPPPVLPPPALEVDPFVDPLEPVYDPYGIHDHGT